MNAGNLSTRPPGETEIDSLLREFFRHEMPDEIRRLPGENEDDPPRTSPARLQGASAGRPAAARARGVLAIAAGCLLVAMTALFNGGGGDTERSRHAPRAVADGVTLHVLAKDAAEADGTRSAPATAMDASTVTLAVERLEFRTPEGPVEMRTTRWVRKDREFDRESGREIEYTWPGIDIEVIPIEDDDDHAGQRLGETGTRDAETNER